MLNSKFLYNNEGICAFGIMSILEIMGELSYSKVMLIAPLIFNSNVVKFLTTNSKIRSFEEFRIKQVSSVSKFNSMYYNFLPLTINTLVILRDMNFIDIEDNIIKLKRPLIPLVETKKIGKRANKIIKASPKFAVLLKENDEKLYLQLGVIL
ncbi:three component ABC system middle component [Clostridium gasigenes]|uniref:three component ABC system middle component n=1 Tax=Clostridium gasigenes TaxID=94869 RepID=UPI001C0B17FC|nr:three component ABC system middle component [Clostridium gasigenes]MBU3109861.1 hypothetical protein [Clostridium gasigenes]